MQDSQLLPELEIPVDVETLQATPEWAVGDAEKEERKWDELETIKRKNDTIWLKSYGRIVCGLTWLFAVAFGFVLLIWVFHHIAPVCWHWLDDVRLSKIQSALFSGGMGAIVSGVIKKQLDKA